jgi:predicted permease
VRGIALATSLLRLLLYAAPAQFRRECGRHISSDFREGLLDEAHAHGPLAAAAFALRVYADTLWNALYEYGAVMLRDLVFAIRSLRRSPLFAFVVIATLALAIGANATAFSILRGVVLAPLPYRDASRLIKITGTLKGALFAMSIPDFRDMRDHNTTLSGLAAFDDDRHTLTGHGPARTLDGVRTTANLFAVLGAQPLLGRTLVAADDRVGSPSVVVISYRLWQSVFSGDPKVIESVARLDGDAKRIVGVMPRPFQQPNDYGAGFITTDYWTALQPDSKAYDRIDHFAEAVGRLRRGVSLARAQADLHTVFARLVARYPHDDAHIGIAVRSLQNAVLGSAAPLLFAIFGAVIGVLLVACANVANLLLSRATAREREFAVRSALGAPRRRIVAQLLTETFLFCACGGLLGFFLAYLAVSGFVALHPDLPRASNVTLDWRSALYTLGIVALATLIAGLIPALSLSSTKVALALRSAGRGGDASGGGKTRAALVIVEIALALALLVSSGLIERSYLTLTHQPLGFSPRNVLVASGISLPQYRYKTNSSQLAFYDRVAAHVRALPGIRDAAWAFTAPFMTHNTIVAAFGIVGHRSPPSETPSANVNIVGSSYFRLLGIGVLRGRAFGPQDISKAAPVLIVNEAFAQRYFGNESALRQQLTGLGAKPATIVGIVANARNTYAAPAPSTIYGPLQQGVPPAAELLAKTNGHADVSRALASAIPAAQPLLPAPPVRPLESYLSDDAQRVRLSAITLLSLAFIGFMLAIAGIYAVTSYGVALRTHELGIRVALGAPAPRILRDVLARVLRTAAIGILAGVVLAAFAARALATQLYRTPALDPLTFGAVVAVIVIAAAAAALLPAERATRVDPIVALRQE